MRAKNLELNKVGGSVLGQLSSARPIEKSQVFFEKDWTMVSPARLFETVKAVKYSIQNDIDGDFVEFGVWRGGNSILAAMLVQRVQKLQESVVI